MDVLEIMTTEPIVLMPTDSLVDASKIMHDKRIRHIPIVDNRGSLQGLITQRDLLAATSDDQNSYHVGDIMRRKIRTISESSNMRNAALIMQQYKIGALPVLRDDKLVGIITDSDYVALAINLLEQLEENQPEEFDESTDSEDLAEYIAGN